MAGFRPLLLAYACVLAVLIPGVEPTGSYFSTTSSPNTASINFCITDAASSQVRQLALALQHTCRLPVS